MIALNTLKTGLRTSAVAAIALGVVSFAQIHSTHADTVTPEAIAATSQAFFDTMNAGDMEGWIATLSPDVVSYEPVGTPANVGHEGLMAWAQANAQMGFQSVVVEVHDIIVAGRHTAVTWTTRFTLPDGQVVALSGIDTHAFDETGLIREIKGYFDASPLMAAMTPSTAQK